MQSGVPIVGYVRVSTLKQAASGLSLEAQEDVIRAYARVNDINLVEVVADRGKSGGSLRRPGIRRVLEMLDSGKAAGVLVTKFDRLTRRVADAARLLDEYFPASRDLRLITASESIDTKTTGGRLVAYILAAVNQHERETTGDRNEAIVTSQRSKGRQLGHVPFGQQVGDDGATLVPCPQDLETWGVVQALRKDGLSTRQIAAELDRRGVPRKRPSLTAEGLPRKRDSGRWSHSTVADILRWTPSVEFATPIEMTGPGDFVLGDGTPAPPVAIVRTTPATH